MTMQSRKPQGEREAVFGMGWRKASARIVVGRQPLKKVLPGEILHWQKNAFLQWACPTLVREDVLVKTRQNSGKKGEVILLA